jgi:hypothetical protein
MRANAQPQSLEANAAFTAAAEQARKQAHSLELVGDPVGWSQDKGILWWSKQAEIALALEQYNRVAVRSCHDSGKSFVAATLSARWIDSHPPGQARVVTTAPTATQVRGILWVEINQLHERCGLVGRVNQTEWWIGSYLAGMGRKPSDYQPAAFQGLHARFILIIIDEASGVSASLIDAAETLATNINAKILMIGNPDDPSSEFAKINAEPEKYGYHIIKIAAWDTPNFTEEGPLLIEQHGDEGQTVCDVLLSPQWVESRRRAWGIDHPFWSSKVEAEFPSQDAMAIVPLEALLAASIPFDEREGAVAGPSNLADSLGVDVAGSETGDETVIRLLMQGNKPTTEWRVRSDDPSKIADLVDAAQIQSGARVINIDAIGVGFGVVGLVRERVAARFAGRMASAPVVVALNSGASPTTPAAAKLYGNLRAQIWWEFRLGLQQNLFDFSKADNLMDLQAQLLMPRYRINKGKIWVEAKEDIRKRLGRSPDNADALMYSTYQSRTAGVAIVARPTQHINYKSTNGQRGPFAQRLVGVR